MSQFLRVLASNISLRRRSPQDPHLQWHSICMLSAHPSYPAPHPWVTFGSRMILWYGHSTIAKCTDSYVVWRLMAGERLCFFSADAPFPSQDVHHGFMVVEHWIYFFIKSLPFFLFHDPLADKCVTLVLTGLAWQ